MRIPPVELLITQHLAKYRSMILRFYLFKHQQFLVCFIRLWTWLGSSSLILFEIDFLRPNIINRLTFNPSFQDEAFKIRVGSSQSFSSFDDLIFLLIGKDYVNSICLHILIHYVQEQWKWKKNSHYPNFQHF